MAAPRFSSRSLDELRKRGTARSQTSQELLSSPKKDDFFSACLSPKNTTHKVIFQVSNRRIFFFRTRHYLTIIFSLALYIPF